jgi:hypothetical protein
MKPDLLRLSFWSGTLLCLALPPVSAEEKKPWALAPIQNVRVPPDRDGWSASPVDRFLRARQRERGLEPTGLAGKRTLIRRLTFDLIGLPPTPAEVEAFVADHSPDAYAKLVERLLASPHYGERWGRHWLDVVRYADTGGFEQDYLYVNAWRYRDYVIRSLNADKPFDRMIQEQIAGDELWPEDPDAVAATGMYAVGPVLGESAMVSGQLEYEWLTDAVDTTGSAFLGLTLACCRCHNHKYDPFTQKDYFALQAIFAASDRPFPERVRVGRIKSLNGILSEVPLPKKLENDRRCTVKTEAMVGLRLFHRAQPLTIHRLHRGELSKAREVALPALPVVLRDDPQGSKTRPGAWDFTPVRAEQRRAAFARWLTSPDNPLTARVLVNRVWGWHFGQGIVRTPNDFGAQGEAPTHPELLDWLARDFSARGWSLKHLHRRILLSRTYQLDSAAQGSGVQLDPENRLLWHFPRRRLEGEVIRDSLLACAGTVNLKPFGPAVVPPLSKTELTGLFDVKAKWPVTKDAAEHTRRSVYLVVRRTFIHPLLAAFDAPEMMTSCPQRSRTVVPTQALTLLNSPLAREQADAFAGRLLSECGDREANIIDRAWQLSFARLPTPAESRYALDFLKQQPLAGLCLALFNANEFIYID